jgi:hypothetical protein
MSQLMRLQPRLQLLFAAQFGRDGDFRRKNHTKAVAQLVLRRRPFHFVSHAGARS